MSTPTLAESLATAPSTPPRATCSGCFTVSSNEGQVPVSSRIVVTSRPPCVKLIRVTIPLQRFITPRKTQAFISDALNVSLEPSSRPFIHSLRPICEIVFNLLLVAYSSGLKVFHHRSASRDGQRKSLDGRDKSLKIAVQAVNKSQDAEVIRRDNLIVNADATVEEAFKALRPLGVDVVPIAEEYMNTPLMNGCDDSEVAKV